MKLSLNYADFVELDKAESNKTTGTSNSMMQTMYRLEIELGDLQRSVASTEITSVVKTLEVSFVCRGISFDFISSLFGSPPFTNLP